MIRVFCRPCGTSRAEQHEAAYALLWDALTALGHPSYEVARTEEGKPFFPDAPGLFFSLSHSDGYAVCAIGSYPCGVDMEQERPLSEALRSRFLGGASQEEGIRRWTMRESYGKLTGKGFFAGDPPAEATFVPVAAPEGYVITVCVWGKAPVHTALTYL